MARNGSGTFVRLYNWQTDAASGIKIRADRMDGEFDGVATALSESIARDGQTTITADLPMAGFNHTGVGAGSARGEYARVDELQDNDHIFGGTAGGTADDITAACTPTITAYVRGMTIGVEIASTNTGAMTLDVDGVGASAVKKYNDQAMAAGDLEAGQIAWFSYEDTADVWHLQSPVATTPLATDVAAKQDDVITTRGDIVRGDSGGAAERVALGTTGYVVASDGTDAGWTDPTTLAIGGFGSTQIYTSDDTWSKPAGLTRAEIIVVGAGGGGGGSSTTNDRIGAGGGGGGVAIALVEAASLGATETVTVGTGGGGGTTTGAGSAGGNSSFGAHCVATGGGGGAAGTAFSAGGTAGALSTGDYGVSGRAGAPAQAVSGVDDVQSISGGDAGLGYGYGAYAPAPNTAGNDGADYGGGGSGGYRSGTSAAGGDGADGIIIVREYF